MKSGFLELAEADLRAHTLWLRRLAAQLVRGESHAEDAVQDTLVAALRRPPALDRDVRPWLARVLANFTRSGHRSEVRRRRRETAVAGEGGAGESAPGADELLERHEAARVVAGLVSGLGEPHRGLVLLRFAEGLSPKEIARRRGVPEGTVRRQFKEALDQLRAAVAAHYGRDARDWRLALVPLVQAGDGNQALAGAMKGMALMAVKSKTKMALGLGLAVLLALVATRSRWWPGDPDPGSAAAPAGSEDHRQAPLPPASSARAAGGGPRPPGSGAPPPAFTARAAADWPGCPQELTALRALASGRALVSPAAFDSAPPSPRTESEFAPIVAAMMGRLPGKPSYQLECRPALCRIGAVTDPDDQRQPPAWLRSLGQDETLTALRGPNRNARVESVPTRDALTGASLLQHWLYFNVPLAAGEAHPFEVAANASTCGQRVAALQKALDEQRDEGHRQREDQAERQRQFRAMPVNQELTRRMEAAFRLLTVGKDGAPAGAWECRGRKDCRWSGPASVARAFGQGTIEEVLASQGLSADQVMARLQPKKEGAEEGEAEMQLRLADGPHPDGGPPAERRRVMVESVSTEKNRD
jgi:RNA polymerase sigma factor (sigma-70 family)